MTYDLLVNEAHGPDHRGKAEVMVLSFSVCRVIEKSTCLILPG